MTKPRKVNTIKALKWEIDYYKRQLVPVNTIVIDRTSLKHMRLQIMFEPHEIAMLSNDAISDMVMNRLAKSFTHITNLPIKTNYDERLGMYRAELDVWVKE
jgi:hypothetical protein